MVRAGRALVAILSGRASDDEFEEEEMEAAGLLLAETLSLVRQNLTNGKVR